MAPLPKKKYPKARQRQRRSHIVVGMPHLVTCTQCHSPRLPHHVCPTCGSYRERDVLLVEEPHRHQT